MSRTTYTNPGKTGVYIGTVFIPAGGTRTVDAALIPPPSDAETPQTVVPLSEELAGKKVTDVIAELPTYSLARIDETLAAERAGKDRKTLVEALEFRRLEVLSEQEDAARERAEVLAHLANLDESTLEAEMSGGDLSEVPRAELEDTLRRLKLALEVEAENLNRPGILSRTEQGVARIEAHLAEGPKE